jgi:tol-pal system protein YbgF
MRSRSTLLSLSPLLLVLATGCFATRNDVRLLQEELRATRAAQAQSDSARRMQLDMILSSLDGSADSLRALSARFTAFQGSTRSELYDLGRQLITIQELTGQGQRRIQELRATLEDRTATAATTDSAAAGGLPGPNRLFELAREQLTRGSYPAARDAFGQLLTTYPTSDLAPTAQFFVAEAYAGEGNRSAADSVYRVVLAKHPRSDRAPTAMYKLAQSQRAQGRTAQARRLLEQVVRDYPRSDEATLARDQLRTMR